MDMVVTLAGTLGYADDVVIIAPSTSSMNARSNIRTMFEKNTV